MAELWREMCVQGILTQRLTKWERDRKISELHGDVAETRVQQRVRVMEASMREDGVSIHLQ
jgi:hypothetical protein